MTSGVTCFINGCTEPVIGQRTGYQGACMRFYCAKHSSGTLCSNCAERKAHYEKLQAIYEDYLHTAESIRRPGCGTLLLLCIPFAVLSSILVDRLQLDPNTLSASCVASLAFLPGAILI